MTFGSFFYDAFMFPFEIAALKRVRKAIIPLARGNVLEIGPGSGANLAFLSPNSLSHYTAIDLSAETAILSAQLPKAVPFEIVEGRVEELPFAAKSFDTVIFTLVFCSVITPEKGLEEISRVLKDDGQILFIEHVLPHKQSLQKIFNRLTPAWEKIANNCHLNRKTCEIIEQHGFHIVEKHQACGTIFVGGRAIKEKP
jgi:ubiquinone/menaquinone biosynthesis C-methylase UbiE